MTRYSVQPRDRIFVNGYGFLSFIKKMGKNIDKNIDRNINKSLNSKYSQKLLDYIRQYSTDMLKTTLERVFQKMAEAEGDLTENKTADKITGVSKD